MEKFMTMKGGHAGHNAPLIDNRTRRNHPATTRWDRGKAVNYDDWGSTQKASGWNGQRGHSFTDGTQHVHKEEVRDDPDNDEIQPLLPTNI